MTKIFFKRIKKIVWNYNIMINFIINFLNVTNEKPACTTWPPQWNLGQNGIHSKSQTVYIKEAEWSTNLARQINLQILNLIFLVISSSLILKRKKKLAVKVEHFLCLSRELFISERGYCSLKMATTIPPSIQRFSSCLSDIVILTSFSRHDQWGSG